MSPRHPAELETFEYFWSESMYPCLWKYVYPNHTLNEKVPPIWNEFHTICETIEMEDKTAAQEAKKKTHLNLHAQYEEDVGGESIWFSLCLEKHDLMGLAFV